MELEQKFERNYLTRAMHCILRTVRVESHGLAHSGEWTVATTGSPGPDGQPPVVPRQLSTVLPRGLYDAGLLLVQLVAVRLVRASGG